MDGDNLLAAVAVRQIADDLHPLPQFGIGGIMQHRDMNEGVGRSICGGDKAESLGFIEKFNRR